MMLETLVCEAKLMVIPITPAVPSKAPTSKPSVFKNEIIISVWIILIGLNFFSKILFLFRIFRLLNLSKISP